MTLEPPPASMSAQVTHDGVVWDVGRRGAWPLFVLGGLLVAGGLGAVAASVWGAGILVAAGAGIWLVGFVSGSRRIVVRLTDRAIAVEHRTAWSATVERLPLDELRSVRIVGEEEAPEAKLVLRGRDAVLVVGVGRPEAELVWMAGAIDAASAAFARREQAEGREWTFLRKAPEALRRLTDRPPADEGR